MRKGWACALFTLIVVGAGCGGGGLSDPTGGISPPPPAVTVTDIENQIFTPRCATSGCHVAGDAVFDLVLSSGESYDRLVNVPSAEIPSFDRVEPGNATDSYLYMKVADDPRILGDPMPFTGPRLSAGELQLIADWINDGAPR